MNKPELMQGGVGIDDRGEVGFVNDFKFTGVKRFYTVANHRQGFIRAWHAHKKESKYVTVVKGAAVVCAIEIDDWENPSRDLPVSRFVLSEKLPSVLYVPHGHANGFMSLSEDTVMVFFSDATVEESRGDDFRYEAHYWDPWKIIER